MLQHLRAVIEARFGVVLILACVTGFIFPGLEYIPDVSASVALAILTYTSCFKLRDSVFADIRWRRIFSFYVLRFILLPPLMWWFTVKIAPSYASGIFLLALMPAAVSSPAFSAIYGGGVASAFALVVVSQLLTPFVVPLQFANTAGLALDLSPIAMFRTLILCILLPILAYFLTHRAERMRSAMYNNLKLISILLVFFVIALVIAKARGIILADPGHLLTPFILIMLSYAIFISCGWWLAPRESRAERIAYTTCSAFNNVALGVSLALLYFPPDVTVLIALSEIGWSLMPSKLKLFLRFAR